MVDTLSNHFYKRMSNARQA